jgi:type VI secretion system protein ImpC
MSQSESQAGALAGVMVGDKPLESLLKDSFRSKDRAQQERIERAVQTLGMVALEQTALISDDAVKTIESMIAAIDRKLSEQLNLILHHPEFQQLEGAWRGLRHLVYNTETDETLKIKVLNISRKELASTIKKFDGIMFDQSPLFKMIYEKTYGTPGGVPYGAIIGDFYFDHTPPDVKLLEGIAKICASCHTPFIAGASPNVMGMESWQEMDDKRDLTKIFQTAEYAPWRSLRDSDDSRYIGLTLPRFLSRLPYGSKTNPVEEFNFEESTEGADSSKYTWSNAAYAMGTNITRAFKLYGWCSQIRGTESGGIVEGLPCHTFPTDDGGVDMKCPTEIAITDRREAELAKNGFMPLSHYKNTDYAVFFGAQSLHKPPEFQGADGAEATANANLGARLPYMFAVCRFAHYLKVMVRDKIGSLKERADMEKFLNDWITNYVVVDPTASEETKARYPLAAAKVVVEEIPGNPGYYSSKFFLRPHYQLEGLSVSLRLVSKLPSKG